MKILFIGDVVGRTGRRILKERIPYYVNKYEIDFVIANGENATHGKGLNRNHYFELLDAGVDAITLGNHYMSKSEILRYIDNVDRLIRPYNLMVLDNEWGVAAYCENKQEIRHFYLNRITLIKELDEKF